MPNEKIIKHKTTHILKAAVVFLIALRFFLAFIYPVFSDATQYFYLAKHPSLLFDPNFTYYPPLEFILGAFLYKILGEIGLKLMAPFFGTVAIFFTYKLGKELFDEKRGLMAAILLGIIPSHIYLSSMGYQDSIVAGLSVAFIYYFYKSFENGSIKAGITAGMSGLSKLTGVIVFPITGLYYIAYTLKKRNIDFELLKKCVYIIIIGLLISSPYYIRTFSMSGSLFGFQIVPPHVKTFSLTSHFEENDKNIPFSRQAVYHTESTIFDYLTWIYYDFWGIPQGINIPGIPDIAINVFLIATAIMSILFLYGMIIGTRKNENEKFLLIYIWALAWIIALLILKNELMWGFRRLLPVAPILALMAARGFDLNRMKYKKIFLIILILAVIVFPAPQIGKALYAHNYFDTYSDALQYIKELPENSVVLIHDDEQALYYTEKKAYNIGQLNPAYLNMSTLRKYNITHVVRFDGYLFYDLSTHNRIVDEMAGRGELNLEWQGKYVKIFSVNYRN